MPGILTPGGATRSRLSRPLLVLAVGVAAVAAVSADDWPQWRGPANSAVSDAAPLPTTWSATQGVAWRAAIAGLGTSSPIVVGDRVIVTSQRGRAPVANGGQQPRLARDDGALAGREAAIGGSAGPVDPDGPITLVVEAFDRASGGRLWAFDTPAVGPFPRLHEKHNLATPTPVSDGTRVYAWFGTGQLVALDLAGKPVWTRHLGVDYAPFEVNWGHGSSPAIYRDLVLLLCDHQRESYLLALDAKTGKERWKVERGSGRVSHSTPVVVAGPKGDELLINSSARIDAYDPATGTLLWHTGTERQTPIPSAVSADGRIILSRGYRNSDVLAIRPGGRGDVTASHVVWTSPNGASYVPSIVAYRGLVYLTNEIGIATCLDAASGERVWRQRLDGVFFASPVAGDGKVFFVSETGETVVLRAGRTADVLARNDLGERFVASPAIAGGRLFLRSDRTLFAIGPAAPAHGQSKTPRPALPAPLGLPAPATATAQPYAPQPIVAGGVVVPLYPAGSLSLKADRVREVERYTMSQAVPGRISSIVSIHHPSIESTQSIAGSTPARW